MSLRVSGPDAGQLSKAIQSAMEDNVMVLQRVLKYKLDMNLSDVASPFLPLPQVLFELIGRYNARYEIDKLTLAILEYNPVNEKLLEFAWKKNILQPHRHGAAEPEPLERMLDPVRGYTDPMAFLRRFAQITRCICRISVPTSAGTEYGTGLLVGDSTVLTNYHVVQSLIRNRAGADPKTVQLLFDYHTDADGKTITAGALFKLADTAQGWLIDYSEYDAADLKVRTVADNANVDRPADKLDYALLRVADAPGTLPVGQKNEMGAEMRGHIELPADAQNRLDKDFDMNSAAVFIFSIPTHNRCAWIGKSQAYSA